PPPPFPTRRSSDLEPAHALHPGGVSLRFQCALVDLGEDLALTEVLGRDDHFRAIVCAITRVSTGRHEHHEGQETRPNGAAAVRPHVSHLPIVNGGHPRRRPAKSQPFHGSPHSADQRRRRRIARSGSTSRSRPPRPNSAITARTATARPPTNTRT